MKRTQQDIDVLRFDSQSVGPRYLMYRRRNLAVWLTVLGFLTPVSLTAQQNSSVNTDDKTGPAEVRQDLSRARQYAQEGNLDKAVAVCEQALQAKPDDRELLLLVAKLTDARGRELIRDGQKEKRGPVWKTESSFRLRDLRQVPKRGLEPPRAEAH